MDKNLIKAMTWDYPAEIPVSVGILPAMWLRLGEEMVYFAEQYPDFIGFIPDLENYEATLSGRYTEGLWTDEWGCVWENEVKGMDSLVVAPHPVPTREDVRRLEIPKNRDGSLPHGFMYLRLIDLRGFNEIMMDFGDECDELQILIDKVLEYNLIQIDCELPKAGECMGFGDDLGMQNGLAMGAEKWRKYLKPCFAKMYKKVKDAGKLIYMHTDGQIYEIMPDLKECGVDMINPQLRANGLGNLVRVCKGKIPINLDLDRQIYPFATPSELDGMVRGCVEELYLPEGGLGLSIEFNYDVPLENAAAILDAVRKYKAYKG
ncbi:MAG: uroporphyrinogen decarboxylase family protein [Oscillospiraceae bacterium]|nr:uroporphyrinogen decarboxylase family protein [Oscillospiraceae bacterium]